MAPYPPPTPWTASRSRRDAFTSRPPIIPFSSAAGGGGVAAPVGAGGGGVGARPRRGRAGARKRDHAWQGRFHGAPRGDRQTLHLRLPRLRGLALGDHGLGARALSLPYRPCLYV